MQASRCSLTGFLLMVTTLLGSLVGQQAPTVASSAPVPQLVNYSGKAIDSQGRPIAGIAGITFSICKDQNDGAPLWMETPVVARGVIRKQRQLAVTQQAQMKAQEARVDEQQNQIRSQTRLSELQQGQIAHLLSQIQAIEASLKTNGRTRDTEIRTVKARAPMVQQ